jgi:hypothetical protein
MKPPYPKFRGLTSKLNYPKFSNANVSEAYLKPKSSMSVLSSTPEEAVLLACLRVYFRTKIASEVDSLLTADLDWEKLVQTAISKSVMPLLYESLKEICTLEGRTNEVKFVPQSVMMQLKILSKMNGHNNIAQTKELLKVLALLAAAGIEAIAFKGPTLAAAVYGDVALRQFNDLDLLVRRQDFQQTIAILIDRGYQSNLSKEIEVCLFDHDLETPLYYRNPEINIYNQRIESSLLNRNLETSVDLHWAIPPRQIFNPDRCERLWANLNSIDLLDRQIKIFAPEATLVIQCINVAKEYQHILIPHPIAQICDVAKVIQAYPNLNWHLALEIAAELQSEKLFSIGLFTTQDLLKIELPQLIIDRLNRILGSNFTLSKKYQTLRQLFVNPLITMDWSLYSIVTLGLYLQQAISPNQNDLEFLPLPRRLFFLYYLIRPIRLLVKYSPLLASTGRHK